MEDDELADLLGILPKEPVAPFDAKAALALPPRERFTAALKELGRQEDDFAKFKANMKAGYERDLEEKWRAAEPRGRKKFVLSKAETELADAANELVAVARGVIEAYRVGYHKARELLNELAIDAAKECVIRPGEQRVEYKVVYFASYSTQTDPAHYAKVRATLHRYDLLAMGVPKAEVECDKADGAYYVFADGIHGDDAELLPYKPGERFANQVMLSWRMGVNPRVYWSFLPHDYEQKNGFDQFGNWLDLTGPVQLHTPDAAQSSEFVEPEII